LDAGGAVAMVSSQARKLQLNQTRVIPGEFGNGSIVRFVKSLVELSQ